MNLETIEKLIQFMEQHGLSELQVKEGELEFKATRGGVAPQPYVFQAAHGIVHSVPPLGPGGSSATLPAVAPPPVAPAPAAEPASGKAKVLKEICSPIVGTFYRKPNPTSAPYKEVGDRVEKDDVVCIVEAMKVMNEIRAEVSGRIAKLLVEDSSSVEFGQPLFMVELD